MRPTRGGSFDSTGRDRSAEAKFMGLLEAAPDAVVITDPRGRIVHVNAQTERSFRYARGELVGQPVEILLPPCLRARHAAYHVEFDSEPNVRVMGSRAGLLGHRRDGSEFPVEISLSRLDTEDGPLVCSIIRDITERKRAEEEHRLQEEALQKASVTDELTGLLNRRGFMLLAEQEMKRAGRNAQQLVLAFIDLNGMKEINDRLGHTLGDRALVDTAVLLRNVLRASDIVARLGGDEYVVLMADDASAFSLRLRDAVDRYNQSSASFRLSLSIGWSIFDPSRPSPLEELLADADARMYRAKRSRPPSGLNRIKLS